MIRILSLLSSWTFNDLLSLTLLGAVIFILVSLKKKVSREVNSDNGDDHIHWL